MSRRMKAGSYLQMEDTNHNDRLLCLPRCSQTFDYKNTTGLKQVSGMVALAERMPTTRTRRVGFPASPLDPTASKTQCSSDYCV